MKFLWAICLSLCFLASSFAQKSPPSEQPASPAIGLAVGQKAPAFSLRDQFGRDQTLELLKGPKGTVVLFFRSADW